MYVLVTLINDLVTFTLETVSLVKNYLFFSNKIIVYFPIKFLISYCRYIGKTSDFVYIIGMFFPNISLLTLFFSNESSEFFT